MNLRSLFLILTSLLLGVGMVTPVSAVPSVKVTPLEYRTTLEKGERKRGVIDISNPSAEPQVVTTSVSAFRQIDDKGNLEFYQDEQIKAGVELDLREFELGPREAIRMVFQVDGTKLPPGDVFASIFFTTKATSARSGVVPNVRVGTLLSITNGTPGARSAVITSLEVPFFQLGSVRGSYRIKNTADPKTSTGFYPKVTTSLAPFGQSSEQTASLLFAGRERQNTFQLQAEWPGFQRVRVAYGDTYKDTFIFVANMNLLIAVAAFISVGTLIVFWLRRRAPRQNRRRHRRRR